ncbi:MAG: 30S ribosome-binding factor RbfA [Clostridia bacterium]|nr:30S ribosome-binding factor RbfA [Clostridia bacterium]
MKGKTSRTSRLNGEYQKEISNIIFRLKDKQPDLKGLVSVTETDVAPDLKTAIVYVSIYASSEEEKMRSFAVLQECAGFIRHELSKVMQMRTVPALTFRMDGSMTYGAKMDELFKKLHENDPKNNSDGDDKKDEEV